MANHCLLSLRDRFFTLYWLSVSDCILDNSVELSLIKTLIVLSIDSVIFRSVDLLADITLEVLLLHNLPSITEFLDSS